MTCSRRPSSSRKGPGRERAQAWASAASEAQPIPISRAPLRAWSGIVGLTLFGHHPQYAEAGATRRVAAGLPFTDRLLADAEPGRERGLCKAEPPPQGDDFVAAPGE